MDNSRHVQVRFAPDLFTVETGAEESYSFDSAACLVRAAWDGHMYRWGLDGGCLEKVRRPFGVQRERRLLSVEVGMRLAAVAYRQADELLRNIPVQEYAPAWRAVAQTVQSHGYALMQKRTAQFPLVYKPVGIMPPDQYGALVLQLTEGCRYNHCAFCTFYKDIPYRVKSPDEFAAHIQAVLDLVGPAINRRRTVFLGDANALGLPFAQLSASFELVNRLLPISAASGGIEGIYTFMDVFGCKQHNAAEFQTLAKQGLRRVYVGAESGSEPVLQALCKPEHPDTLRRAVQSMKDGGVGVGLVFLLGAGGTRYANAHAEATAALLAELPLDADDIVYFSELVPDKESAYAAWAAREEIVPLTSDKMKAQEAVMRQGLVPVDRGGPRVTRYDVREFIYY